MGSKRRANAIFKTKSKKPKKKSKRKKRRQEKNASSDKTVNDLCAILDSLDFNGLKKLDTSPNQTNATSKFLSENNLDSSECKISRKRKSKKNIRKTYSMLKILAALPEQPQQIPSSTEIVSPKNIEQLPFKIVSNENFLYRQQDSKKFYKKILKKERSRARKSKRIEY